MKSPGRLTALSLALSLLSSSVMTAQQSFVLHDGTPVKIRLNRELSSATARVGETADFEVIEDIKVNEVIVIKKGAVALGTVTEAKPKRRLGRAGKLNVNIDYVRTTADERVPLRGVQDVQGAGSKGKMTGAIVATSIVFFPAAPFFLFWKGKDIVIPQGHEVTVYVNGETPLERAKYERR